MLLFSQLITIKISKIQKEWHFLAQCSHRFFWFFSSAKESSHWWILLGKSFTYYSIKHLRIKVKISINSWFLRKGCLFNIVFRSQILIHILWMLSLIALNWLIITMLKHLNIILEFYLCYLISGKDKIPNVKG